MAVVTFIKQHRATTDASSFTFSSTSTGGANDIGATASDRQVIISGFITGTATAVRNITSVTPGGVAAATATQLKFQTSGTFINTVAHTFVNALLTTATSISVVLTATTTVSNATIAVWSATHVAATFATYGTWSTATGGYITATGSGDFTPTVGSSGFVVAHVQARAASQPNFEWDGITERHDTSVENNFQHSSADTASGGTFTCSSSATNTVIFGLLWAVFDDESPTATGAGETLFRKFTFFPGTVVGRRKMVAAAEAA